MEKELEEGSFVPEGPNDILSTAIGRPEHPGCVYAVGVGVTINQYFGRVSQGSSRLSPQDLEALTQQTYARVTHSLMSKYPNISTAMS